MRRLGTAREFSCGSGLGSCDPGPGLRGAAFASCGSVFGSCGPAFASRGAALGQIIAEGRTRAPGRHIRDHVRCWAPGENCEGYAPASREDCDMSIRPAPARHGERLQSYGCSAFTGESPSSARKCRVIKLLKYVRFCQSQTSHRYMLRRTG